METQHQNHHIIASTLSLREVAFPHPLHEDEILELLDHVRYLPTDNTHLADVILSSYVRNPFTPEAYFDFPRFGRDIRMMQHILDDMIIEGVDTTSAQRSRLGINAEGEMLSAMGLTYGSAASIDFCVQIHRTLVLESLQAWRTLLAERAESKNLPENVDIKSRLQVIDSELAETLAQENIESAPTQTETRPIVTETRPTVLEADVVRFQNNKEKWVAFVGLLDGRPYEIFTGLMDDDEGIMLPKSVTKGRIIKAVNPDGSKRYDFQFENKRGYKTTVEGLSEKFNPEYWNYAKLISGVLRYQMPLDHVIRLVSSLQLESQSINTWKVGVERALKKYSVDDEETEAEEILSGQQCPICGQDTLVYEDGILHCRNCGTNFTSNVNS